MLVRAQYVDGSPELRVSARSEGKRPRQHTDDRVGVVVEIDCLPDQIEPRAKAMDPRSIAQDHYIRPAWPVLSGIEVAAQHGMHAERLKKATAYTHSPNRLSAGTSAQK